MKSVKMFYVYLSLSLLFLMPGVSKSEQMRPKKGKEEVLKVPRVMPLEAVETLGNKPALEKLYQTEEGKVERSILTSPTVSKELGVWANSSWSKRYIPDFLKDFPRVKEQYNHFLGSDEKPITSVKDLETNYKTFNEFFYRKLSARGEAERPIDTGKNVVVSPADCHLFVIPDLSKSKEFFVKGCKFDLEKFLANPKLTKNYKEWKKEYLELEKLAKVSPEKLKEKYLELAELAKEYPGKLKEKYQNGTLMLFRLAPDDYHRFHFPFTCVPTAPLKITGGRFESVDPKLTGRLESVDPIAYMPEVNPLNVNIRHLIMLNSTEFGDVLLMIVGAMGVGGINETYTPGQENKKGKELGYFDYGASSLVLIFEKGVIEVEKRFVKKSAGLLNWEDTKGKYGKGGSVDYPETRVRMGEKVATKKGPPEKVVTRAP